MLAFALKILACLLVAAAIGFVVAWLLRGNAVARSRAQSERLSAEIDSARASADALTRRQGVLASANALLSKENEAAASKAADLALSVDAASAEFAQYRESAVAERESLRRQLAARTLTEAELTLQVERLSNRPAGEIDDLKRIFGVGPVLEKLLHELGVHHFRQVATWSEADIDFFDAKLEKFRGRIRRENWVRSAIEEHYKKHGEWLGPGEPAITVAETKR